MVRLTRNDHFWLEISEKGASDPDFASFGAREDQKFCLTESFEINHHMSIEINGYGQAPRK